VKQGKITPFSDSPFCEIHSTISVANMSKQTRSALDKKFNKTSRQRDDNDDEQVYSSSSESGRVGERKRKSKLKGQDEASTSAAPAAPAPSQEKLVENAKSHAKAKAEAGPSTSSSNPAAQDQGQAGPSGSSAQPDQDKTFKKPTVPKDKSRVFSKGTRSYSPPKRKQTVESDSDWFDDNKKNIAKSILRMFDHQDTDKDDKKFILKVEENAQRVASK
jgi:hypothetical protein